MPNAPAILIAEDDPGALKFMTRYLESLGCDVISAIDGGEAMAKYDEYSPDIVVTDFNMPRADGLEVINHIRQGSNLYWTPVIVLSAQSDNENIIRCLEAGADDYITKPVNLKVLHAKIKTYSKLSRLQNENLAIKSSLEDAIEEIAREEALAEKLLTRMLESNISANDFARYIIKPATRFSGDLVSIKDQGDNTLILVADSTGHGLTASLPTLVASQIFHSSLESTEQLSIVASNLNEALFKLLPAELFVAATLIKLNHKEKYIELWTGGLPDALVKVDGENSLRKLKSEHLPLGILRPDDFDASLHKINWNQSISLFACSDGFFDIINHEQSNANMSMVCDVVDKTSGKTRLKALESLLEKSVQETDFKDDVTLFTLDVDLSTCMNQTGFIAS
ncbi:MAG: response regulator [Methylophaga sp.]|nr:response regulator [Methylophaga sp.]